MDDRWEPDTLFLVFEEDFRFRQGQEPKEPPRQAEPATFFAEPSAAKGSGQRQRQVRSKKNAGRRRFPRKRMHETLKIFGSATILLSVPCMTRLPCEPSARGIPDR